MNSTLNNTALHQALLDALRATFGHHPGWRATHAKGVLAGGTFVAGAEAKALTRAAHLQGQAVAFSARFSNFSGVPGTADGDPGANPRGLALRFMLADGGHTDIVAHSFDGFPVATPEAFLTFLEGIAAGAADPPDPAPLAAFLSAHPVARAYLDAPKPAPSSYLAESYYGVNTFRFLDARGRATHGRYRIEPVQAAPPLSDERARAMPPDFLARELAARLRQAPCALRLMLQIAAPGDALDDGSLAWPRGGPSARREITLGTLTVETMDPAGDPARQLADQRALDFNPGGLTDGIEASGDPMIGARAAIYRLAARRRQGDAR